jgi:aspartyl aminopeptidase
MDRPLGLAGRIIVETKNGVEAKLVNITEPILMIPNLPIHYNRNVNKGVELNPQIDMLPIFADKLCGEASLKGIIAKNANVNEDSILSSDLYLTLLDRGCMVGPNKEFIMAPQIDNLECSFGCMEALLNSTNNTAVNVCALFDNEEIGSGTMQGAAGTMLSDILERISLSLGRSKESHLQMLASSFIVSADNAQGFHPNYPGRYDETNPCYLNEGIVIKNAARGSYSTDAMSSAFFQKICKNANAKYQLNTNRSDIPGGSTLGVVSIRNVSIPSVDIGLAQLAMHSAYETAGIKDTYYMVEAMKAFYNSHISETDTDTLEVL